MDKYGELYKDKNVSASWKHRAWALPLAYFYRRTAFAIVTVFVFDWPNVQMIVHIVLTLATCIYLLRDSRVYLAKEYMAVELMTEFLLLFTSATMQQYTVNYSADI